MARQVRKKSETGIYHVIFRGINKQNIFEDDEDREKFLGTLKYYKRLCNYLLYGYCLMDNHIHLLINEYDETISQVVKRISASYVSWYNEKYERCGHLFQERFKSEVVESEEYFLIVLRYIHQNPVKAGITQNVNNYLWSSYQKYYERPGLTDIDFALDTFSLPTSATLSFKKSVAVNKLTFIEIFIISFSNRFVFCFKFKEIKTFSKSSMIALRVITKHFSVIQNNSNLFPCIGKS